MEQHLRRKLRSHLSENPSCASLTVTITQVGKYHRHHHRHHHRHPRHHHRHHYRHPRHHHRHHGHFTQCTAMIGCHQIQRQTNFESPYLVYNNMLWNKNAQHEGKICGRTGDGWLTAWLSFRCGQKTKTYLCYSEQTYIWPYISILMYNSSEMRSYAIFNTRRYGRLLLAPAEGWWPSATWRAFCQ